MFNTFDVDGSGELSALQFGDAVTEVKKSSMMHVQSVTTRKKRYSEEECWSGFVLRIFLSSPSFSLRILS